MRADALGLFWQDKPTAPQRVKAKGPDYSTFPKVPEGGLGFAPSFDGTEAAATRRDRVPSGKPIALMDIECYVNYFLVKFRRLSDGRFLEFELLEGGRLNCDSISQVVSKYEIVTFNGCNYDVPMLRLAMTGASTQELKAASDAIIKENLSPWQFEKRFQLPEFLIDHVDLIEIAPGMVGLKLYAARLHSRQIEDLPYKEDAVLTVEQMAEIRRYCGNDLVCTEDLLHDVWPQLELRRQLSVQYHMDLRSKSDAQIAEEVLKAEITALTGRRPVKRQVTAKEFYYQAPEFITTTNSKLYDAIELVTTHPFTVSKSGNLEMPQALLTLQIFIGRGAYQMGMGGLHSTESSVHHFADEEHLLADWDVTSYYPSIILNCELFPAQLGRGFLEAYRKIVEARVAAKAAKDKVRANTLKIVVNGSFGKLGSMYSALYAPELMVQVTVTGQLSLLMLIDELEFEGIPVVSANTDGVVARCPRDKEQRMVEIIRGWEERTGFQMERADYLALFSKDVNNYIAVHADGYVKTKGCFKPATIDKNPSAEICSLAVIEHLKSGVPIAEIICGCKDITKFVMVRRSTKGAEYKGQYLGKVVRWYYAKGCKDSVYTAGDKKNLIPLSEGACPLMVLPDSFPEDVDYARYEKECQKMLRSLNFFA